MRNLGLALVLIGTITAPHTAMAKKHIAQKKGRPPKVTKKAKTRETTIAPAHDDALVQAVAAHKREDKPVMTSAVAPTTTRRDEPVSPNAPMNMSNQDGDDEVPGTKKRK
jgi:hypothetical protein